jgi:tricorn protease
METESFMRNLFGILALAILSRAVLPAATGATVLPQRPTLSKTHIVFTWAGDLWVVPRQGGEARRLTTAPGIETNAIFSPDGETVVFSGSYDGNTDIFSVPLSGGEPKRLTYHPASEVPIAFTPGGQGILFRSGRTSPSRFETFFTMGLDPGPATPFPLPMGDDASYSPDGKRIAYTPLSPAFRIWKHYRGGTTSAIWIANLDDSSIEKLPRDNSNDFCPMWAGDRIYFLSDRNGAMTLFSYDLKTKQVTEAVKNTGLDYRQASLGPGGIVLERFGQLEIYDLKGGKVTPVEVHATGDLASLRPSFEKVGEQIRFSNLSPTGARAVFEARGDIYTAPGDKGDVRNITNTSGVAERSPAWSPDGKEIAYFSDASGEYQLHIARQDGMGSPRLFDLDGKAFYYSPLWAPDGKKILFRDSNLKIGFIDLESKKVTRFDADFYHDAASNTINPSWSPDSAWIVYTKLLKNRLRAVFVYSLKTGAATQLTDGLSDARYAAFDKGGKYIYFTASTNTGFQTGWLDMSSEGRVAQRNAYLIVLAKDEPSPFAPESDEEKADKDKDKDKKDDKKGDEKDAKKDEVKKVDVRIDFEGIAQCILAMPVPERDYDGLAAGKEGIVFIGESVPGEGGKPPTSTVYRFEMKTRKSEKFLDGAESFDLSADGEKALIKQGERWFITSTTPPVKPGEGTVKTALMEARIDPVAEWRQMYHEAWRIERDFLYDPNSHGLNLAEAEQRYAQYLPALGHRADLNYLFGEMLGNLVLGHTFVGGGAYPQVKSVPGGLLGADYSVENGRYRFARVYDGENWNPSLRAPLTQPGVNVKAGDYLLAVNGREVKGTDDVFSFFESTSGKSVILKVGPSPDGAGSREVTVVPVGDERGLRYMAWVEDNRRKVERLSGGRLGYVHLPDTAMGGFTNFNRWYFAQIGKDGIVLDERFNGGGDIADYIVDALRRPLLGYFMTREGHDFTVPMNAIFGPKAMIVNEYAGSGGDAMPWMFHKLGIGPLIGKRTWGGLVGIYDFPSLIDGGGVTAPNLAFYNTEKQWDVENRGVKPDVEVELDPALVRQGRDPQLEKTVEVLMEKLKTAPLPKFERPAFPNYYK